MALNEDALEDMLDGKPQKDAVLAERTDEFEVYERKVPRNKFTDTIESTLDVTGDVQETAPETAPETTPETASGTPDAPEPTPDAPEPTPDVPENASGTPGAPETAVYEAAPATPAPVPTDPEPDVEADAAIRPTGPSPAPAPEASRPVLEPAEPEPETAHGTDEPVTPEPTETIEENGASGPETVEPEPETFDSGPETFESGPEAVTAPEETALEQAAPEETLPEPEPTEPQTRLGGLKEAFRPRPVSKAAPARPPTLDPWQHGRKKPATSGECSIAIVQSDFNHEITDTMAEWATRHAQKLGASIIDTVHVAGVFDTPLAVKRLLLRDDVDAVVVLGCVVQGQTGHDEVITHAVAHKLLDLACDFDKPVGLGITGPRMSWEQAEARVGVGKHAVEAVIKQHALST